MTVTTTLPGSRWRSADERRSPAGAVNRVRDAQAAARGGLRLAVPFLVAAPVATVVPHDLGAWLPLHLLLAGGASLAISATTLFFTVTWSAATPPPARLVAVQRVLVAAGAAGVTSSRAASWPTVVLGVAAATFAAGLALLAVLLVSTVRHGVERRYDVPVAWYVAALAAGLVAAGLGAALGTGTGGPGVRPAHVGLNLLGFLGLVVGGTVPSFAATVGRARMWPGATPRRHGALLAWQVAALALTVAGALAEVAGVTALGLLASAAGVVGITALTPRFTRRQLDWAGPRLLGLHGALWWWAATLAAAAFQAADGRPPLSGRPVAVLAVGGLAQLLWASLCYLLPVLRGGGHERLSAGFAATRSWSALVAVNVGAAGLATGQHVVAGLALAWFAAESAVRFGLVAIR